MKPDEGNGDGNPGTGTDPESVALRLSALTWNGGRPIRFEEESGGGSGPMARWNLVDSETGEIVITMYWTRDMIVQSFLRAEMENRGLRSLEEAELFLESVGRGVTP